MCAVANYQISVPNKNCLKVVFHVKYVLRTSNVLNPLKSDLEFGSSEHRNRLKRAGDNRWINFCH